MKTKMFPPLLLNLALGGLNPKPDFVKSRYFVTQCVRGKWVQLVPCKEQSEKHTEKVNVLSGMILQVHCSCSDLCTSHNQTYWTTQVGLQKMSLKTHLAQNCYSGRQFHVAEVLNLQFSTSCKWQNGLPTEQNRKPSQMLFYIHCFENKAATLP